MPLLRCPACGYSKEVAAERLPPDLPRIKCPKCQQVFAPDGRGESETAASADSESLLIKCPHCQNEKRLAASSIPPGRHQLRCGRCEERFEYLRNSSPPAGVLQAAAAGDAQLPPVIDLFSRCWKLYQRRVWTLLGIYLLTVLAPVFLIGVLTVFVMPLTVASGQPGLGTGLLGLLLALLTVGLLSWGVAGMIVASVDATAGIRQSLAQGWQRFWSFGWLFFLLAFIVTGGFFLLVIPALLFMTWFLFAQYILVDEGERGMAALLKSREYVRGYFWGVLLRLLVLWVAVFFLSLLLGWIPLVGSLFQLLLLPFTLLYQFMVFQDIRQARSEQLRFHCTTRQKLAWVGMAALGYLVLPVAIWLADVPGQFNQYLLAWQLQNRGYNLEQQLGRSQPAGVYEEKLGREPAKPQSLGRKDYRNLLQQAQVGFAEGGLSLGPAALKLDHFWDGSSPHQWLKVRVAALPNLELAGDAAVRVRIDQVLGDGGSNQYDSANLLEKEYFQQVELKAATEGWYDGHRDVHLRPGTSAEEISRISGAVQLRLPLGIQTLSLTPSHMGEDFSLAGHAFNFKSMQQGTVELEFPDGIEPLLQLVGYNSDGQPLADAGTSWSEANGSTTLAGHFQGELFTIKVIMARDFTREEYPFDLYPEE
jgi:predicted Zn finger-like uncharacterized protein